MRQTSRLFLTLGLFVFFSCATSARSPAAPRPTSLGTCSDLHLTPDQITDILNQHPFPTSEYRAEDFSVWFQATVPQSRGVALVVHGLNTKPSKMNRIVADLNRNGIDVFRLSLSGHRGSLEEFKTVTREIWQRESFLGYCAVHARALEKAVPAYFVGFSAGALSVEDLMNTSGAEPIRFDRAVLFAPAISVHWYTHLIKTMEIFGSSHVVGSHNLPEYRANDGTPVAGYEALFDSLSALNDSGFAKSNIPTLVFIHPDDELVSYSGLQNLIPDHQLSQWKLEAVSNSESTLAQKYAHLIIDDVVVGPNEWDRISTLMTAHLLTNP